MRKNYEKVVEITGKIIEELKTEFPKMKGSIFAKNLLGFLKIDNKILNPSRTKIFSEKKYQEFYETIKKTHKKAFIFWLLETEN